MYCSLLKPFERNTGEVYSQYVACQENIVVEGRRHDVLTYSKKFDLENKGGLISLNNEAFYMLWR